MPRIGPRRARLEIMSKRQHVYTPSQYHIPAHTTTMASNIFDSKICAQLLHILAQCHLRCGLRYDRKIWTYNSTSTRTFGKMLGLQQLRP